MKPSAGGQVALALLLVMFGVFAFTTDLLWLRIGCAAAAVVVFAGVFVQLNEKDD